MFPHTPGFPQGSTKNVLIVGGAGAMQDLRGRLLRGHGVQVHSARNVREAEMVWVAGFFDLVLLDARDGTKDALTFWRMIRRSSPKQRVFFLVGPAHYLSATCADEVIDN